MIRLKLEVANASNVADLDSAFADMLKVGATALFLSPDPVFTAFWQEIALRAVRHALPTMSSNRAFVVAGGLMSYDSSLTDSYRQAGVYVGRILKGERPADLPVQQPTKFELVINLKVAKVIGLMIPEAFLLRADELIE
jgi:putative ABC transport system substrate-binding protein